MDFYDEYYNKFYNPDDDEAKPGDNLNWKKIQRGFKRVEDSMGYVMPEMFGAKGDGITDDTEAIQEALDSGFDVVFLDKTYMVSVENYDSSLDIHIGVKVSSNTNISMGENTIIKAIPTSLSAYNIISLDNVENVTINGGNIVGDREDHLGSGGEWGMGLAIYDSSNINVSHINITKCWGDGLYLGNKTEGSINYDLSFSSVVLDNNRRNGCSIVNGEKLSFTNCKFINTDGTAPKAGLDAEVNHTYQKVKDLIIEDCYFGNNYYGLMLNQLGIECGKTIVINCHFDTNYASLYFNENINNETSGEVFIKDILITGAISVGMIIGNKLASGYRLDIDSVNITTSNRIPEVDSAFDGFIVNRTSETLNEGQEIGNIFMRNMVIDFSKTTPPAWLITQNLRDKTVKIECEITSAKNAPVKYVPLTNNSEFKIIMPSDNALETTETGWNMSTKARVMATNLILVNQNARHTVILGANNGDLSRHYIMNKSGQGASIYYIDASGTQAELILDNKKMVCIQYDTRLERHVFEVL